MGRELRRARRIGLGLASLVVVAASCSSGGSGLSTPAPPATDGGPSEVLVAIGGGETTNVGRNDLADNWTQLVFATQPPGAVYVNLATDNATIHSALEDQLPQADALHPTVAMIWVESADARLGTPPEEYRDGLTRLVDGVRQAGASRILLLTPALSTTDAGGNLADSIAQVATATGATLVNVGDVSDRGDDSGQRRIADAVGAALGQT